MLHEKIEEAYRVWDEGVKRLDDFEAQNPSLAAQLPWFEARQRWKREGRKRPEWYEVLHVLDGDHTIIGNHIEHNLYCFHNEMARRKQKRKRAAQQSR